MEPLAHSARPQRGIPVQLYADHVRGVVELACAGAREAAVYSVGEANRLVEAVRLAAEFHDLGKLEAANQAVLMSGSQRNTLPVNHVDAGVAHLFDPSINNLLAATLVYAHHIGLPDFPDQCINGPGKVLRDLKVVRSGERGQTTKAITDQSLRDYLQLHEEAVHAHLDQSVKVCRATPRPLPPLLFRIALSCLVDADHSDSAGHDGKVFFRSSPSLQPDLRLALLDKYIAGIEKGERGERNEFRSEVYRACRNADPVPGMYACDSPVGTGKTTAVMAHLLQSAQAKGLRRIFVVLPFTNIIDQSVEVYRDALVCPGELQEDVVAAHHHRAEFADLESRHLSFLWKAPIVVTTAVQFFETLAANRPAGLRKLHQIPGSAIFIDEAHAALPAHLWPQAWKWLRELQSEWGCHFVFGSGSLHRFWELEEFSPEHVKLPDLVHSGAHAGVARYETHRIRYLSRPGPVTKEDLVKWLAEIPGPRILIVNTVQSAAVLAENLAENCGHRTVEHLSTSLCPHDRRVTLERVRRRLDDRSDSDWTLVATSCVEAGVNLSFRNGLRERCSLNSLIQVGGRVSRAGEYTDSIVWDFELQHDGFLKGHPAFEPSARILGELFTEGKVCAEASTEALRREVRQDGIRDICDIILKAERNLQFPSVADKFTVIDSDTVTAIVNRRVVKRLERHELVDPATIQRFSVQIWRYRESDYALEPVTGFRDLYAWPLLYNHFLGYMAGVLQKLRHEENGTII